MHFKTMKEALASIKVRTRDADGKHYTTYDAYLGVDPITKKVKRMFDTDRPRLVQRVKDFYSCINYAGELGALLNPMQIMDAKAAYDILAEAGIKTSLRDIAKGIVDARAEEAKVSAKPVGEAYDEYLASFGPLQKKHVDSIKYRVGHWVVAFGREKPVSSATVRDIVSFIDGKFSASPKSWNNALVYIRSFLAWCMGSVRGYVAENVLRDVKQKQVAWKEPEYLKPQTAEALLRLLETDVEKHPDRLAYTVLNMLCGMRREEIMRMASDPDAVRVSLPDETVRVAKPKGFQKGIRPRAFHIPANALAWMKSFDFAWGVSHIIPHTTDNISAAAKDAGLAIPHNAGRHTFITMHCAAYGDPSKTEAIVGTSAQMRAKNYMGLASKADGEAFFAIMPKARG